MAGMADVRHGHAVARPEGVNEQFEDIEQQNESYIVGMWTFLVTEVMFFGALFLAYAVYRWAYQSQFYIIHKDLNWILGGINTTVLLTSSFTIALAVHYALHRERAKQLLCMGLTLAGALVFLIIKYFEYSEKYAAGKIPGVNFTYQKEGVSENVAQLFYSLYFAMTGLHGIHVLIGILVLIPIMYLVWRQHPATEGHVVTEMYGLYWHFVDIVWIFLYPLFYLLPK